MRTVSLPRQILSAVDGAVLPAAVALADIDSDGLNELVVGSISGCLYVFGGTSNEPLVFYEQLGFITAVCCGQFVPKFSGGVRSCSICVTCGDGLVHVLSVESVVDPSTETEEDTVTLSLIHTQTIPSNVKQCVLYDIDQDDTVELILALTDRVVRVYRWCRQQSCLRAVCKCEMMQQIGNISVLPASDIYSSSCHSLLVSQPGGAVVRLEFTQLDVCDERELDVETDDENCTGYSVQVSVHDLSGPVTNHMNVSCEVLPWTDRGSDGGCLVSGHVVATSSGELIVCEHGGNVVCKMQLHHQLFAIHSFCTAGDGDEYQLAATSWDGHTFIMDSHRRLVQFMFGESVMAFTAGRYSDMGLCLIYITTSGYLMIHKAHLPSMTTTSLTDSLRRNCPWTEGISDYCSRALYRWCLYNPQCAALSIQPSALEQRKDPVSSQVNIGLAEQRERLDTVDNSDQ